MKLGIILLAAGSASRMGRAKQLLLLEGQPLIRRACETALQTGLRPVITVLGCRAGECEAAIQDLGCEVIVNADWESGMGSSIRCGMEAVLRSNDVEGVLILLHDQVLLNTGHLKKLSAAWESQPTKIVAAQYGETTGTPAIFPKAIFAELLSLPAAAGAKKLISRYEVDGISINIPEAEYDVDTPEDYKRVLEELRLPKERGKGVEDAICQPKKLF